MPYFDFLWTEEIIAHLAEHDISPDDFEHVVMKYLSYGAIFSGVFGALCQCGVGSGTGPGADDFERHIFGPLPRTTMAYPKRTGKSRASGDPAAWGYTQDGRYIIAVYHKIDFVTVMPVTAYEVPEPPQ